MNEFRPPVSSRHALFRPGTSAAQLGSVLARGARCTVKVATNEARVADCRTARGELCDAIVEDARTAVRTLGLRLAGVDLVTADPSRPLRETGGVINEVNGTPALHRHYQVADRRNVMPVAEPVLAHLLGLERQPSSPAGLCVAAAGRRE